MLMLTYAARGFLNEALAMWPNDRNIISLIDKLP
jgi:hypothetical protein